MKHREKRYWSFWDKDIVVLEMQMMVIVAFEGMQWLKTMSCSKCKWGSLSPFESMQWLKTLLSSKCKWGSLSPFESMQWLKTLSSSKCKRPKKCLDWFFWLFYSKIFWLFYYYFSRYFDYFIIILLLLV